MLLLLLLVTALLLLISVGDTILLPPVGLVIGIHVLRRHGIPFMSLGGRPGLVTEGGWVDWLPEAGPGKGTVRVTEAEDTHVVVSGRGHQALGQLWV